MTHIYRTAAFIILLGFFSCETAMEKSAKFQRPYWLEGKVYSVAQTVPELSTFVDCIERTGYDKIIDVSGLYTIMAPTNTAFDAYFAQHPQYASIDDIDSVSLSNLVKMHIVLKSWSKDQLRLLNTETGGWIDSENEDAAFTGFKRETSLKPPNKSYRVQYTLGSRPIINPNGNLNLVVYSEFNKYAPFFYSEYMDYTRVSSTDFSFYYDRPFESSEIFYAGAKLLSTEKDLNDDGIIDESYPAENGFVYLIDRVIEPLASAEGFLTSTSAADYQYNSFGTLINEFATFDYNEKATLAQEGANEGLEVDNLYDINYPSLSFNIADESTNSTPVNTIAFHHALFAPTNEAYSAFIEDVIVKGDGHYEARNIPDVLKSTIVDAHMAKNTPYYPSQAGNQGIFFNALGEKLSPSDISEIQTVYGSNATLVGVDKVVMPRVFKSVASPLALRKTYASFYGCVNLSGLLRVVNNLESEFTLLAISDASFDRDSTLTLGVTDDLIDGYEYNYAEAYSRTDEEMTSIPLKSSSNISLRTLTNGQIALGTPKGICRKEFLRTLSGFYAEFDNVNKYVSGGVPTAFGFMGNSADSSIQLDFNLELTEDFGNVYGNAPVNGKVYSVESWLTFPDAHFTTSSLKVNGQTVFYDLVVKAGLVTNTNRFNFLSEGEVLTVLIPTDAALATAQADTLQGDELSDFVKAHFVTGATLFTDNISKYPTPDNYFTKNGKSIRMGSSNPDEIDILNQDGSFFYSITENGNRTNTMYLGWDNGDEDDGNSITSKKKAGIYVLTHLIDVVIPSTVLF